jgi:septum formation protein
MGLIGIPCEVRVPEVDEEALHQSTPRATALAIALAKAGAVMESAPQDRWVLAADTVVALGKELLLKPSSPEEAAHMLAQLAGQSHEVITAVALGRVGGAVDLRAARARVSFRSLTPEEIENYIATGEPFDKAGGYGIQGAAGTFVSHLDGDFYSVMGLPADLVTDMVAETPWAGTARLRARQLPRPTFPLPIPTGANR